MTTQASTASRSSRGRLGVSSQAGGQRAGGLPRGGPPSRSRRAPRRPRAPPGIAAQPAEHAPRHLAEALGAGRRAQPGGGRARAAPRGARAAARRRGRGRRRGRRRRRRRRGWRRRRRRRGAAAGSARRQRATPRPARRATAARNAHSVLREQQRECNGSTEGDRARVESPAVVGNRGVFRTDSPTTVARAPLSAVVPGRAARAGRPAPAPCSRRPPRPAGSTTVSTTASAVPTSMPIRRPIAS